MFDSVKKHKAVFPIIRCREYGILKEPVEFMCILNVKWMRAICEASWELVNGDALTEGLTWPLLPPRRR